MDRKTGRRGFLRGVLMAGVSAAGTLSPEELRLLQAGVEPPPAKTPHGRTDLPTGKLGKLSVSRLIEGGEPDQRLVPPEGPAVRLLAGQGLSDRYIRGRGLPAGLGSHALEVPQECDKLGIVPDFYFKTFHHDRYWSATPKDRRKRFCVDGPRSLDHNEFHDNIFCIDPEETAAYMRGKKQPWIAFKVLAAGAMRPPGRSRPTTAWRRA